MTEICISGGQIFPTKVRSNVGISGDFDYNCLGFFVFPIEGPQATNIGKTPNWGSKVRWHGSFPIIGQSNVLTVIST